jgi:diguanylate cyclase (GGDEF)-like protein
MEDTLASEWLRFRELTTAGRSAEAIELADQVTSDSSEPLRVAQALIEKLAAVINTGEATTRRPATAMLVDAIEQQLRRGGPHARLAGEYAVLSGIIAYLNGSLNTALTCVVRGERAIRRMIEETVAAADAWHDLSVAYSMMGFHANAMDAMLRGRRMCARAGLPAAICACLETQVRAAVAEDQRGSTAECVRGLEAVVAFGQRPDLELAEMDAAFLEYAAARLGALGVPAQRIPRLAESSDRSLDQLSVLVAVCHAIAEADPDRALLLLDEVGPDADVVGPAEPHRLRSLALTARGDHAAALVAERAGLRLSNDAAREVRHRYVESVGVSLDQERLRRVAAQHADAALSDPLTGLPNRRRLDAYIAALSERRAHAAVGLLDLDGFKAVNDTHGHPTGDLVLQLVAGILARTIRPDDLLVRYGGDEFVVIMPAVQVDEARDVGRRMAQAVDGHDWAALIAGTPISISAGWAELAAGDDLAPALRAADVALYEDKRRRTPAATAG